MIVIDYIFTWLCGGMAFRAVARTHEMLKPENFPNRPLFLHNRPSAPVLVTIGFWSIPVAGAFLGWHHSGLFGIILHPVQIWCASLLLDMAITKGLSARIQYSLLLNPFAHLYVLPWIFIVGVVVIAIV